MLTAQQVLSKGFNGKKVGEIAKLSKTWNEAQIAHFLNTGETPVFEKTPLAVNCVLNWMIGKQDFFPSSSISEKRRWLESGSVIINGQKMKPEEIVPIEIETLVLFPSGQTVTML